MVVITFPGRFGMAVSGGVFISPFDCSDELAHSLSGNPKLFSYLGIFISEIA
jgi:hypothetical protein